MIGYLIYSTLCMALVLLFYHAVLAREKTYQINRFYLLIGLLFSLTIPLMPIGIIDSLLNMGNGNISSLSLEGIEFLSTEYLLQSSVNSTGQQAVSPASNSAWLQTIFLGVYGSVTFVLAMRMILHLYQMKVRSMKNPATYFRDHKVVLLNKDVVPHTFGKTIFVNKDLFKSGRISREILTHELIHARQHHSLDILFIEMVKTICWFNPVLYFYKTAIQVNHEYIADQKVLSGGTDIATYQRMLLNMRKAGPAHYLSTSLNFNITKKRFKMMTLQDSKLRSSLKTALIIPFLAILGITLGCEPAGMEKEHQGKSITLELVDFETIKINDKTVSASKFESAFSDVLTDPQKTLVNLEVHGDAPMGLVTDVQKILREKGALRINYSSAKSDDSKSKESWRSNIQSRNILDLYINGEGDIIANQNQISLSSVGRSVREFLTNNGEAAHLSVTPQEAIIAIRTDKHTPLDTYKTTVGKVITVYNELRDQASRQLFDQPFQSLAEGSTERTKIVNMYPKRISIKDPARN